MPDQDLEARLAAAEARLQELERLNLQFYRNMSHELRTPLSSIIGFAEDALDGFAGPLEGDLRAYFETIHASGNRQLALVTDLLDYARLNAGQVPMVDEVVKLDAIMTELQRTMAPLLARKRQVLTFDLAGLPAVRGDAAKLHQVFLHLVSNAHAYTGEGGAIRVEAAPDQPPGGVAVRVVDTGCGIPARDLPHVFEEFYHVKRPNELRRPSTGLGLAITRQLVLAQGGEIAMQSELDVGTTVTVTLPRAMVEP